MMLEKLSPKPRPLLEAEMMPKVLSLWSVPFQTDAWMVKKMGYRRLLEHAPAARDSEITQPRDHFFDHPCY